MQNSTLGSYSHTVTASDLTLSPCVLITTDYSTNHTLYRDLYSKNYLHNPLYYSVIAVPPETKQCLFRFFRSRLSVFTSVLTLCYFRDLPQFHFFRDMENMNVKMFACLCHRNPRRVINNTCISSSDSDRAEYCVEDIKVPSN